MLINDRAVEQKCILIEKIQIITLDALECIVLLNVMCEIWRSTVAALKGPCKINCKSISSLVE